jgi:hypothetical protein
MNQYLVTTPKNPEYSGKTYGVLFQRGRAFVSEYTIDPSLGWSVDEIVKRMHDDFGYEVERVAGATMNLFDETIEVAPRKSSGKKRGKAAASKAAEAEAAPEE